MAFNINQRLNGLEPLSYVGVNAVQPPDFVTKSRPPNATDSKNFFLGTIWLDTTGYPTTLPKANNVWMLVALVGNSATWVNFGNGMLNTLTGNSGGAVSPDGADNINVVGDGTTITIAGNPGTHTLTASVVGTGVLSTLTGNSGGAVSPLAGNINVVGDGTTIAIAGNPGTHTLTASLVNSGNYVTTLHTDDGHNVTATAGVINLAGTHGLNTTGTIGPNTATVAINNTITLGDLAVITAGNPSVTLTSGDLTISGTGANAAGNINIPTTTSDGRQGVLKLGANNFLLAPGINNTFLGQSSGNVAITGTSSNNTGIGFQVLSSITDNSGAAFNSCLGSQSLGSLTTGSNNSAFGSESLHNVTTGTYNTALGNASAFHITTGTYNIAIGAGDTLGANGPLFQLTTGIKNIAIGSATSTFSGAGYNYTGAESNNIVINNIGVTGESNVMRLGTSGAGEFEINKTWIAGIRGVTTTNADAIAVLIDSDGQLGTVSSSRKVKDNIHDMSSYSECIYRLRPVIFNYKNHAPESVSVGLIAEEVYETAPQLVVHTKDGDIESVKYNDLVPMLLNEIKKLEKRISILENELL